MREINCVLKRVLPLLGCLGLSCWAGAAESNLDQRVEALLGRMTLTEKIGQMVQINSSKGTVPEDLKQRLRQGRVGSMLNEIVPAASQEIQRIATRKSRLGIHG